MADWEAFATAFLRDTAGYINERKDKAEEYRDKLMETAERNKSKLGQLRQAAKAQQGFISQAKQLHATPSQIEAALDSGATGVRDLVTKLQGWKDSYGNAYTPELVQDKIKLPEGFQPTGDIDPMSRYGLKSYIQGDYAAPKRGLFDKALGLNAKEGVRAELDAELYGGTGMSTYDLAQISDIAGYESLNPSSFLTYNSIDMLSVNDVPTEIEALQAAATAVSKEADRIYEDTMDVISTTDYTKAGGTEAWKADKEKAAQDRVDYVNNALQPFINAKRSIYDNYDSMMSDTLKRYGITPMLPEDETGVETSTGVEPLMGSGITVTELAPASAAKKIDTITVKDKKIDIVKTDKGIQLVGPDGDMLSPEESKKVIDATQDYTYDMLVKSYPEPTTPEVRPEDVTAQQMNESLTEPFTEGDPRPSDGFFASPVDKYRAKVWDTLYGGTHNPDGTKKGETTEVQETVTNDASASLLKAHGSDIMKYMDDAGIIAGDSDEEVQAALSEWYSENANKLNIPSMDLISMPDVIRAIRLYLKEE